jgi:hypothetical protein
MIILAVCIRTVGIKKSLNFKQGNIFCKMLLAFCSLANQMLVQSFRYIRRRFSVIIAQLGVNGNQNTKRSMRSN